MFTKKTLLIAVMLLLVASCKNVGRLTGQSTSVAKVHITTDEPDKNAVVEKAIKIIQSKADALGLDVEVARSPDASDVLVVTLYRAEFSTPIRNTLLTAHRMEFKKAVSNSLPPITFKSEEAAGRTLKQGEESLPIKKVLDDDPQTYLAVETKPVITGDDIRNAHTFDYGADTWSVMLDLKLDGAAKFKDWSSRNYGNYLAIVLDGQVLSYPVIKGEMSDSAMIEGNFTKAAADQLALDLNSGYLPGIMTIVND